MKKSSSFAVVVAFCFILLSCGNDSDITENNNEAQIPDFNMPVFSPAPIKSNPQNHKKSEEKERALLVGVIGPESGSEAAYGKSILLGVKAAAKQFNLDGGINGKNIEIVHFDNKSDQALTREIVDKFIQQQVVAILAAPTGWATFAPIHMASESRTVFIAIGTKRRIAKSGPYIFRVALPDELAINGLIAHTTKQMNFLNYALVTASDIDDSLTDSAFFKKVIAKHGAKLVVELDTYDTFSGQHNIANTVASIKTNAKTIDAIIYTGDIDEAILLQQELISADLHLPLVSGEKLFTKKYLDVGAASVRGSLVYASYPNITDSATGKLISEYKDQNLDVPERFMTLAYDTFMLLGDAINTAGSSKSSKVREALLAMPALAGMTGKTSFSPDGSPVKYPFIYRVEGDQQGEKFVLLNSPVSNDL